MELFHTNKYIDQVTYWSKYLSDWSQSFNSSTLDHLNKIVWPALIREHSKYTVYPDFHDTFRVYRTNPENVKVVILGQDPYHNGNANGLAFGCKRFLSPSLREIIKAMKIDLTTQVDRDFSTMSLQHLAEQGVFLLNTKLSVVEGAPSSHNNLGWSTLIIDTIRTICSKTPFVVWLLWGSYAREYKSFIVNPDHVVLTCNHPASASYNKVDWVCDHFSITNYLLNQRAIHPIKWI